MWTEAGCNVEASSEPEPGVYSHTVDDIAEVMMGIACVLSNGSLTNSSNRTQWESAGLDINEHAQTNEQAIQAVISATPSDIGNASKQ